ncbi:2-hydroxyacyl-CoA dehydratase subunit D [Verrucomicrobiota bacterium]
MSKKDIPREFDDRYRSRREKQNAKRVIDELSGLEQDQLKNLRAISGRPDAMRYFEDILSADKRQKQIADSGVKVIGVYCNFAPEELIHAAGAACVRLCSGLPSSASFAEEILPRDVCPIVKSCFGTLVGGVGITAKCDAVIVPASCDGKRKLAAVMNDYVDVWTVDLPFRRDYAYDMSKWVEETRIIRARIEDVTGKRIKFKDLQKSIKIYHRRTEVFRELTKLRERYPHILSGRDMMLVTNSSFIDSVENWTAAVELLIRELKNMAEKQPSVPSGFLPVVLTGSPVMWPNWKVLNILEEAGISVVADTLCSGTQRLYDPVQVDEWTEEGMIRALALRYFSASLCPCFTDSADMIDRVLELAQDYRACGIVSHNLRLCQLIDMDTVRLRNVLRGKSIPFLSIHTDLAMEDREQIKTRVEAFIEMVQSGV